MSKFVKGTSILGVLAISFGVWQLSEIDEKGTTEVNAIQNIESQDNYETVTIEQEETAGVIEQKEEIVDPRTLRSIQESAKENAQVKDLFSGLGQGVTEDLQSIEMDTKEEWKALKKDSQEKQDMIKQLLDLTNDEEIRELAKTASGKLALSIENKSIEVYIETVNLFKYIHDRL
ncbi:hypothetical protein [Halobacillus sp. H74]|uniref:hypothetical protein n=1 Tax=Halobacillus sp. H74 TaxID=3457436 RepID=UPI003FCE79B5